MTQENIALTTFLVEIARECRSLEKNVKRVAVYVAEVIQNTTFTTIMIITRSNGVHL